MEQNICNEQEIGIVKISDEVVSVIAGLATAEVEGIAGMSSGLVGEISQIFTGKKNVSKGVKVSVENNSAIIDLYTAVEYGVKIPELAQKVQANVKKTVETMTGLAVSGVNIYVQNVILPKPDKEEAIE
jgi:uncharacterized alkaline shock family protein YloU